MEFAGRLEAGQIKIRGQRLELAEVEAALVRTGTVSHAAVAYVKPNDGRDPYLMAYVVPGTTDFEDPARALPVELSQLEIGEKSDVLDAWKEVYDDMYSVKDM